MSRIRKDEEPTTTFIDEQDAIEVELIAWPDPNVYMSAIVDVVKGYDKTGQCKEMSESQRNDAIQELISGGTLPKGLEMLGNFVFCIKNISLTVTHCIVRHRYFSIIQRSTAVEDLRDEKFVMPRSFAKDKAFYGRVKKWYLQGKDLYCEAVDKQDISVQNARLLIPKNNCNHMYIGCNLMALREAYGQRVDTAEEPVQNNIIFHKMKDLVIEKFPHLKSYFVSHCEVGRCLHTKLGKNSNVVFKRDEQHLKFLPQDYVLDDDLLHDKTRDEMNFGPEIITEFYIGEKFYDKI